MTEVEVVIKVPEGVPREVIELAKRSAERRIKEWLEFARAAEKVKLSEDDLSMLEEAREMAWKERRRELGL